MEEKKEREGEAESLSPETPQTGRLRGRSRKRTDAPEGKKKAGRIALAAVIGTAVLAAAGAGYYFLETGKCVCLQPEKPDCTACLTEALRGRYETARKTADLYEKAAERWPDMSDEFLCMAADETRHSKCIRSMICRRL